MELQALYGKDLPETVYKKQIKARNLSWMAGAGFLAAMAGCFAGLRENTVLCTALMLVLMLSAYFTVGLLLGIRRQRLQSYADFLSDLETGLATEGLYKVKKVEPVAVKKYGLEMRQLEAALGGKKCELYVEASVEYPFQAGKRYYMQVVGDRPQAVAEYEN